MIRAEAGGEELLLVLVVYASSLLDQGFRKDRESGEFGIPRRPSVPDGLDISLINALLERKERMERDGPGRTICNRVGEQQDLDLRLGEAAAVDIAEQADEAVNQNRRRRHRAGDVRD